MRAVLTEDAAQTPAGLARIKIPVGSGIPRFLKVSDDELYVPLEDVIANNLDLLFPGMVVEGCELFRVTRNAIAERDEHLRRPRTSYGGTA